MLVPAVIILASSRLELERDPVAGCKCNECGEEIESNYIINPRRIGGLGYST